LIPFNRSTLSVRDALRLFVSILFRRQRDSFHKFSSHFDFPNILFTSSCRVALYLAYLALDIKGKVIVSPLTCEDAIYPILAAGLQPQFVDICPLTFNLCPESVRNHIDKDTVAVQTIYIGGNPSGATEVSNISKQYNLALIEDCAHALGARDQGNWVGKLGEAGCFNFTKSIHGVGGALVVRDLRLFQRAKILQQKFSKTSQALIAFRFLRSLLMSSKNNTLGYYGHTLLMRSTQRIFRDSSYSTQTNFYNQLSKPGLFEARWIDYQLFRWQNIVSGRIEAANLLTKTLSSKLNEFQPQVHSQGADGVYTRYMLRINGDSRRVNLRLRNHGIDAKHLSQEYGSIYQYRFDHIEWLQPFIRIEELPNYQNLHDRIITLPLYGGLNIQEASKIADALAVSLSKEICNSGNELNLFCCKKS
jgi:dTDP-4-amino-4,6-dideoxygalactose transaminase